MTTTNKPRNNIFGTVLTAVAPASHYRGESAGSRNVLQKLEYPDRSLYTITSAEAIRSRLREMLRDDLPDKINRRRLKDREQLTVEYEKGLPDRNKYADDMLFGFLMIDKTKKEQASEKQGDSMLRVNYAVSIEPFPHRHNRTMHQSPKIIGAFENAEDSAVLEREVHVTAYQYPFGLNLKDLERLPGYKESREKDKQEKKRWIALLLRTIGELSEVAGNRARTMYPFAPVSIVLRFTARRTPDFDLYGFKPESEASQSQSELIYLLEKNLLPREEFYIGGRFVRENEKLKELGQMREVVGEIAKGKVNLFETAAQAIEALINDAGLELADEKNKTLEGE